MRDTVERLRRIEGYEFHCEAGPLERCQDWIDLKEQIARLRAEKAELNVLNARLVDASRALITAIVNGTVFENTEPSYHNGPMGPLFEAVENLSEAIACSVYRDDSVARAQAEPHDADPTQGGRTKL